MPYRPVDSFQFQLVGPIGHVKLEGGLAKSELVEQKVELVLYNLCILNVSMWIMELN